MFLINKKSFYHVGIDAEDTAMILPAGLYSVEFDGSKRASVFTERGSELGPYHELGQSLSEAVNEEIDYFFTQQSQRGVLVHGGPGNGKTRLISELIMRACAKYGAVGLINPNIHQMNLFIDAIRADDAERPVIVFWDEFDEIVNEEEYEVLRFLDGSGSRARTLSIAALNDLTELPKRIYKRPGRFGLVTELEIPTAETRHRFIAQCHPSADLGVITRLVQVTEGLSLDYVREVAQRHITRGHDLERVFSNLTLAMPANLKLTAA